MSIDFKQATTADLELLVVFMRRFYEIYHYPFNEQVAVATLSRILSDVSLGQIWIIAEGETQIGYIALTLSYSLEYGGRNAFIDEFYIEGDYRAKGIGSQAMEFVERACREMEINTLHLEVERANEALQEFYRKRGFKDNDRYFMTKRVKK